MVYNIGDKLKQLRIEHNFTQKEIADYLNSTQGEINDLENNMMKLNHNSLNKLCKLYGCSPQYILIDEGEYLKVNFQNNLELDVIAEMNNIIKNLGFLSRINKK